MNIFGRKTKVWVSVLSSALKLSLNDWNTGWSVYPTVWCVGIDISYRWNLHVIRLLFFLDIRVWDSCSGLLYFRTSKSGELIISESYHLKLHDGQYYQNNFTCNPREILTQTMPTARLLKNTTTHGPRFILYLCLSNNVWV